MSENLAVVSRHLTPRQLSGLTKVGDALLPGEGELPSFSKSRCAGAVDRILDFMPASDVGDLKTLLGILGVLPGFMISLVLRLLESSTSVPGALGGVLRLIRLGLRGLVMSLYYGDPGVLRKLDYRVTVYTADLHRSGNR